MSGLNAAKYVETTASNVVCKIRKKSLICLQCGKNFYQKGQKEI